MDAQLRADDLVARRARAAAHQGRRAPAYWKATNLDEFDGVRWREGPPSRDAPGQPRHATARWMQTIKVVDRGLRSTQFIGAGNVQDILPGLLAPGPARRATAPS